MAYDYQKFVDLAIRLTEKFGRNIVFQDLSDAPFIDPEKPWKGRNLTTAGLYFSKGVFVPPTSISSFGLPGLSEGTEVIDFLQFSEQIIILHQYSLDLKEFSVVTDRNQDWQITGIQELQPGDTKILAYVGVRR